MSAHDAVAESTHRAVLAYCIVCWGVTVWVAVARWPLVAPGLDSANLVVIALGVINGFVRGFYVPRESMATKFWSGLFHVRPKIVRAIARVVQFASNAMWAALGLLLVVGLVWNEWITQQDVAYKVLSVSVLILVLYPSIEFAVLAALGRDVLYPPPDEEPLP